MWLAIAEREEQVAGQQGVDPESAESADVIAVMR